MSDPTTPALRAGDADREQTVARLREHAVEGRLSLEEFTDRMSTAYLAGTKNQLDELLSDLPSRGTAPVSRRKPTRFVFSVLGSSEREGRIRSTRVRARRAQTRARERSTTSAWDTARSGLCDLGLRRHRCLARAACVDAANLARSDPRHSLRFAQRARVVAWVSRACRSRERARARSRANRRARRCRQRNRAPASRVPAAPRCARAPTWPPPAPRRAAPRA